MTELLLTTDFRQRDLVKSIVKEAVASKEASLVSARAKRATCAAATHAARCAVWCRHNACVLGLSVCVIRTRLV